MRKYPVPTTEQAELMKRHGINFPFLWAVIKDLNFCLIVQHIITKKRMIVDKV